MYPVTAGFLEQTASADQKAISRVDVCDLSGAVLYSTATIVAGTVEEDATRAVRRTCQVTFVDETGDLTPKSMRDLLAPVGHELRLYRGLRIPTQIIVSGGSGGGGDTYSDIYSDIYGDSYTGPVTTQIVMVDEWVPLGVFGISRPQMSTADAGGTITVDGYDRARRISRARLTDTYTIAANTDLAAAVQAMLQDRWPGCPNLTSVIDPVTITHRAVYDVLTDPWQALTDMVTSFGAELFFDPDGVPLLRDIPDPSIQAPVADYQRGLQGVITAIERALDDEQTYSGVLAVGESTSAFAPVRGLVWDTNPLSPTYADGDFGHVVYDYTSSHLTTTAQCETTARKLLPKVTGVLEETAHEQVPNPALQCGDVVTSTDEQLGVECLFSIERVVTPLPASGVQQVSMKARKVQT